MSGLRSSLLLLGLAGGSAGAGPMRMTCAQPRIDPKTGEVVDSVKLAEHGSGSKDAPHGCAPAGGPRVEPPVQPTPTPEPEKPPVVAKPSEPVHREQPIGEHPPSDKQDKTETAATEKKPTDKPADKPINGDTASNDKQPTDKTKPSV